MLLDKRNFVKICSINAHCCMHVRVQTHTYGYMCPDKGMVGKGFNKMNEDALLYNLTLTSRSSQR